MTDRASDAGPALPGPGAALFLDMDGTLLELAARPDEVVVPPELPDLLKRLQAALGGAVAVVTGRGLAVARGYAGVPTLPIGAEHGAVLDPALPGAPPLPVPSPEWRRAADEWAAARPGTLAEHKTHGLVLHFRLRPEAEPEALALLASLLRADIAGAFHVVPAHAAAELRPRAADKGGAVRRLMAVAPFTGRRPIFIGDDVTDEDGMAACAEYGGYGLRVPDDFAGRPALVRAWLARVAASAERGGCRAEPPARRGNPGWAGRFKCGENGGHGARPCPCPDRCPGPAAKQRKEGAWDASSSSRTGSPCPSAGSHPPRAAWPWP